MSLLRARNRHEPAGAVHKRRQAGGRGLGVRLDERKSTETAVLPGRSDDGSDD